MRSDTRVGDDARAVEVLVDLVGTPSVSGSEAAAVGCFVRHARALGLEAMIDEEGSGIATRRGPAAGNSARDVEIVLLGHIDTVPGEIPVRLEAGEAGDTGDTGVQDAQGAVDTRRDMVLHGRGSVDAKGPLCAMLMATSRAKLPPGTTVRVCAAVGEETPHSRGARQIARAFRPDACIIGEPSGWDGVTLGYKGRLVMGLEVAQACHHSAGPGASAPDIAHSAWGAVLARVAALNAEWAQRESGRQEGGARHGSTPRMFDTIQASLRSMETSSDGLMDRAHVVAGFRLPRWFEPRALEGIVREVVAGVGHSDGRGAGGGRGGGGGDGACVTIECEGHECAYAVDRNDAVVRALSGAIREAGGTPRPKLKTGTADLNVVGPIWGCPIAAYGPGDSSLDHTPREHLGIDEYLRSIGVLARAIEVLAGELCAARDASVDGEHGRVPSMIEARESGVAPLTGGSA